MLKILGAFGLLFFIGCATTAPQASVASPKYQLMLGGTVDGAPFRGIAIGSTAGHHDMTITSAVAVNYFTVQSCHRSIQFADVIPAEPWYSFNKDSKGFTWSYDEAPTIEDTGDCLLRFCAFSKVPGSPPVACSIVDFKSPKYQLPSENICNGADGKAVGTSLCHTQVGLLERMHFTAPVVVAPKVVDPVGKNAPYWITNQCIGHFIDDAQTTFEYQVPESECVVIFMEKIAPYRRAKLTVIPYDQAQYPGGK